MAATPLPDRCLPDCKRAITALQTPDLFWQRLPWARTVSPRIRQNLVCVTIWRRVRDSGIRSAHLGANTLLPKSALPLPRKMRTGHPDASLPPAGLFCGFARECAEALVLLERSGAHHPRLGWRNNSGLPKLACVGTNRPRRLGPTPACGTAGLQGAHAAAANGGAYRPASGLSASPKRGCLTSIRSSSDKYKLQSLRSPSSLPR